MRTRDGIIIAIIITTHIPRKNIAAPDQSCPGIHVIDIVQPPGIGIPPIVDMDAPQAIVIAVLAAKSSDDTPKKVWREILSDIFILVVTAKPGTSSFISPQGCPVQPLVYAPKDI